jgi:hypothetical protein
MHAQTNPEKSEEFARLDGVILGLLVDPEDQRPWAETEIAREVANHGNIPDGLDRLHQVGLIHRWDGFVSATRAAVRFHEIGQSQELHTEHERRMERSILDLLLARGRSIDNPLSEKEIRRAISGRGKKHTLNVTDALDRLYAAGLVDRTDELAFASKAAVCFDQIMSL